VVDAWSFIRFSSPCSMTLWPGWCCHGRHAEVARRDSSKPWVGTARWLEDLKLANELLNTKVAIWGSQGHWSSLAFAQFFRKFLSSSFANGLRDLESTERSLLQIKAGNYSFTWVPAAEASMYGDKLTKGLRHAD